VHGQATAFGPAALTFVPSTLLERRERLRAFPDSESVSALEEYGVTHVLVHTGDFEHWQGHIEPWEGTGQLRLERCFGTLCVYTFGLSK
jgi:hypothetical protein